MQKGEMHGVYASLGLILNGILTVILAPYILQMLGF
jgi:putative effector of murein hydrolase